MRNSVSLLSVVLCSLAIAGLMIPFQSPAEASGLFSGAKGALKSEGLRTIGVADDNCAKGVTLGSGGDAECKSDSTKKNYMEPDRKGHKVKKKSRR
ncbi:MAG: hypothetical protein ACREAZ_06900 [Nitrososphaera sp.]